MPEIQHCTISWGMQIQFLRLNVRDHIHSINLKYAK